MLDIKKQIDKYGDDLLLLYYDSGSWVLYKKRPPEGSYSGEKAHDECVLAESGDNFVPMDQGYTPGIVILLCKALGIKTESY